MLPSDWRPRASAELVRVGRDRDGGYVIPAKAVEESRVVFGFGVFTDWSFEEDFRERTGARVICYDHSIDRLFWRNRLVWDLLATLMFKRRTRAEFREMFLFRSYRRFFGQEGVTHHALKIGPGNFGGVPVLEAIQEAEGQPAFLKIDIEGWEYRVLDELTDLPEFIRGMVIEFHDVDLHADRISRFLAALGGFELVHIHGNNFGGVDQAGDPYVLEMTFARMEHCDRAADLGKRSWPLAGLDRPNRPTEPDIKLNFGPESS